jgi:nucleoside 2-deoxyribosyltransferase
MDMKAERQAAVMGILDSGHIPAGMELFAASDKKQIEVIHRWIDRSDIFMLILGGRYGSIDSDSGKSYIHLEYDYAIAQGKPFFALYLTDDAIRKKVQGELGLDATERVDTKKFNDFRALVKSRLCREIEDLKDIHIQVEKSIRYLSETCNLEGWIRAGSNGNATVGPRAELDPKIEIVTGSGAPYNVDENQSGYQLSTVRIGIRNAGGKTLSNCKVYVEQITPPSESGSDRKLLQGGGFRLRHDDSEQFVDIASHWDHMDKFKFNTPSSGGMFVQTYDMRGNGRYTFLVKVEAIECQRSAKFELVAEETKKLHLKFLGYAD